MILQAFQAGAQAYLLKGTPASGLVETVRQVYSGKYVLPPHIASVIEKRKLRALLTPREVQVLTLIARGLRNKEIAWELQLSEETIHGHTKNIFAKLNV